jgi:hypothetical protein
MRLMPGDGEEGLELGGCESLPWYGRWPHLAGVLGTLHAFDRAVGREGLPVVVDAPEPLRVVGEIDAVERRYGQ